jgi:hypothetical protein
MVDGPAIAPGIAGILLTVTVAIAVLLPAQPALLVPITEYDVLLNGLTTGPEGIKVYVLAPPGVMVKEFPEQILPLLTVIAGLALTVTSIV